MTPHYSQAMARDGWSGLFATAFEQSRNAMILTDGQRVIVDVNPALVALLGCKRESVTGRPVNSIVAGRPPVPAQEWAGAMTEERFTGVDELLCADGRAVAVQWAASTETVTGRRLVLFVVLSVSRWGKHFRRSASQEEPPRALTPRQREIVHLVALGASGPEIGDELRISHETVRTHVRNAMDKLGARSRAHLVAKALGDGLTLG
jgi:PAS domain S-box-containing protein